MHNHHPEHEVNVKKIERLSSTRVKLTLAFPPENVKDHQELTLLQYQKSAKIPGFRPGKAPLPMVRQKYRDDITKDVLSHLLDAGVNKAIEKTKFVPVNRPRVEVLELGLEDGKSLEFSVEYEIQPEIEIRDYKGIPVPETKVAENGKAVEEALEGLRDRFSVLEPVETERVTDGQFAVVEMAYEVAGNPPVREPANTFPIEVGKGRLLPELDKALLEMKVGESRKIPVKFPADYHKKELAEKEALFDCKLVEVKAKVLPELNDTFANQVRAGLTFDQLKQDIETNVRENQSEEAKKIQRQAIVDYLIQKNRFDVPQSLVETQAGHLYQNLQEEMGRRGMKVEGLKEEEIESLKKRAERMVRSSLVLREVAVKENIALDEARVDQRIEQIAAGFKQGVEDTRKYLTGKGIIDRLRDEVLTDQVFEFLLNHAEVQKSTT